MTSKKYDFISDRRSETINEGKTFVEVNINSNVTSLAALNYKILA